MECLHDGTLLGTRGTGFVIFGIGSLERLLDGFNVEAKRVGLFNSSLFYSV